MICWVNKWIPNGSRIFWAMLFHKSCVLIRIFYVRLLKITFHLHIFKIIPPPVLSTKSVGEMTTASSRIIFLCRGVIEFSIRHFNIKNNLCYCIPISGVSHRRVGGSAYKIIDEGGGVEYGYGNIESGPARRKRRKEVKWFGEGSSLFLGPGLEPYKSVLSTKHVRVSCDGRS